ncbi:winged helix-turn-helix domain-containing protein [Halomonas sp. MA07-2]|uniref:winged helix-turn-helix domain-containing protein n=1 Tax=unclassified Halomonas TaxID=2609666 RepID=UPI003EEF2B0F
MTLSKTKSSFYRRLYVAHLVSRGIASIPDVMAVTGMPRRTAQDTLGALGELDIVCEFEKGEGARHNIGAYVLRDWGPIDPDWVAARAELLRQALGYPPLEATLTR